MNYSAIETEQEFIDLINQIEDVNTNDTYHKSLLYSAAQKGFMNASKLLCERGADVNAYNNTMKYDNVLNAACNSGNIELIEFLLNQGANVVEGYPYMMHGDGIINLLFKGHHDLVKFLLEKGWSTNSSNLSGTVLQAAIQAQEVEIFKILLEKGDRIHKIYIEEAIKTDKKSQFIDILLNSDKSPLFLEIIFSEAPNKLGILDDILLPLCIKGASNMDNFDLTESFENLFAEQIDLIGAEG